MPDQQDLDRHSENAAHNKTAESGRSATDCSPVRRYVEDAPAKALPLWRYRGALTHVQSIPEDDRKTLFQHKLTGRGSHPLEENAESIHPDKTP